MRLGSTIKGDRMNRTDLVSEIAKQAEITQTQASGALGAAIEAISAAVADGDKVTLPGFGTFESRERAARTGRNPQTGKELNIPASRGPAFKPGSAFKERVNKG
ncbi:HU family DNA-binding protein [Nocardioides sp. NPDC101246]|uniref:HU family DNA-binding protein n=1 Tax=Nocardioides sp. NPDC101246 TaxID=3364336 RepID=UPI00381A68EF